MRLSAGCTGHDSNVKMGIRPIGWKLGEIQESRAFRLVSRILADPQAFCVLAVLLWRVWRLLLPDGSYATCMSKVRVALPAAGKTLQSLQCAGIFFLVDRSVQTAPSLRGALRRCRLPLQSLSGVFAGGSSDRNLFSDYKQDRVLRSPAHALLPCNWR